VPNQKLLIGEDPLTTTLFWDGITCQDANNYTCSLFHTDGSASLVLKRITWDGANKLATLVVYVLPYSTKTVFLEVTKLNSNTWDGTTNQGRGYSGNGRHEDCIYQNAGVGTKKTQHNWSFFCLLISFITRYFHGI